MIKNLKTQIDKYRGSLLKRVIIVLGCLFIFCREKSLLTETNSPGVNKIKAWHRLKSLGGSI